MYNQCGNGRDGNEHGVTESLYEGSRVQPRNQNSKKLVNNTDYTNSDTNFIMNYASINSDILDLWTRTGLLLIKYSTKYTALIL